MSAPFKRDDTVWVLFGRPFNSWWMFEKDDVLPGRILDAFDDGLLIVEYGDPGDTPVRDWFGTGGHGQLRRRTEDGAA